MVLKLLEYCLEKCFKCVLIRNFLFFINVVLLMKYIENLLDLCELVSKFWLFLLRVIIIEI